MKAVEVHDSTGSGNCPLPDPTRCSSPHDETLADFAALLKHTLPKDGKGALSFVKSNVPPAEVKRAVILTLHKLLQIEWEEI